MDPWARAIGNAISSSGWPVHRTGPAVFDTEPVLGSYHYASRRDRVSHEDCTVGGGLSLPCASVYPSLSVQIALRGPVSGSVSSERPPDCRPDHSPRSLVKKGL